MEWSNSMALEHAAATPLGPAIWPAHWLFLAGSPAHLHLALSPQFFGTRGLEKGAGVQSQEPKADAQLPSS